MINTDSHHVAVVRVNLRKSRVGVHARECMQTVVIGQKKTCRLVLESCQLPWDWNGIRTEFHLEIKVKKSSIPSQ